jgi:hypothetical protein
MSQLDDLIARSRAPGAFKERRRFTLSRAKAIEKQREYALRHPSQYILELIQAAVLSGATYIAIDISQETMLIAFIGGRAFQAEELENVFDYLFADRGDLKHRHLVQLAIGLNALLQRKPRAIRIESGDGKKAVRLDMDGKGKGQIGIPADAIRGTYLMMEKPGSWFSRFQTVSLFPEQALVEERCVYSPVPIILNGVAPFGYTSKKQIRLFGEKNQRSFSAEAGRRGVLAVPKRPGPPKGFKMVMGGVWVTTLELPELGVVDMRSNEGRHAEVQLFGVIADDNLRKTADQSDVVQDARFTAMLRAVQPAATSLIEEVTGQPHTPPPLPDSVDEDGPSVLPVPQNVPVLGPEERLPIDEVRREAAQSPIFWLEPGDRERLSDLADPLRFPFRALVLQEGEARSLVHEMPHISLQRLGTAADVDFVRRVLDRRLQVHEVEIELDDGPLTGTLRLHFHGLGPRPPWGDEGGLPFLLAHGGRATWCGSLPSDLRWLSGILELREALEFEPDELEQRLVQSVEQEAWRLLLQPALEAEADRLHELAAGILGLHARPQLVEDQGVSELAAALPPEWGRGASALRELPLGQSDQGPLTLEGFLELQGSDRALRVDLDTFVRLEPLERRFGYGHLAPDRNDAPLVAVGRVGGRWVDLGAGGWGSARPTQIVWLSMHQAPRFSDARWRQVEGPAPMVGCAVREGEAPEAWPQGWQRLLERLRGLAQGAVSGWSELAPGREERAQAMARLARLHLCRALDLPLPPLEPSDGSAPRGLDELRTSPRCRVAARGGVEVAERDTFLVSLDELRVLERDGPLTLRFDDDPEVWGSLVRDEDEAGWLLKHEVRLPGLRGWLGLRMPFDATAGVLVRCGSGRVLAVSGLDERVPCHGLLWLEAGRSNLSPAQSELLTLEGLQLYQRLAQELKRGLVEPQLDSARRYGILFAWLCWKRGRAQLGTVEELARLIPIEADGEAWGTLESWLRSPESHRPGLPIALPALGEDRKPETTALAPESDLARRTRDLLVQVGIHAELHLQSASDRYGGPVRVDTRYSRFELLVLVLNELHPVVQSARSPGRFQELLLLEIARHVAHWSKAVGQQGVGLLELQQVLLAQRLELR